VGYLAISFKERALSLKTLIEKIENLLIANLTGTNQLQKKDLEEVQRVHKNHQNQTKRVSDTKNKYRHLKSLLQISHFNRFHKTK
jgi:hypothetical protein